MKIKLTRTHLVEETAAKPVCRKSLLCEDYFTGEGPLAVDRTKNIISNVKILGWKSKNKNRRYSPNGVDPSLYEGAVVNIDHPDADSAEARGPRPLAARFGEVTGIYKNGDGLYARELHYNPKHALAEQILYMAESKPHLFGCSQNAFGDVYEDATGEIVETVTDVRSIDLVSEPATTKGLYEAVKKTKEADDEEEDDDTAPMPPKDGGDGDGDEDDIPLGGPPSEDEEPAAPPATPPAAPPAGEEGGEEEDPNADLDSLDLEDNGGGDEGGIDISDEMMSMIAKVLNSNLDAKAKKKKLGHIINAHSNLMQEAVMKKTVKKIKTLDDAKRFLIESDNPAVKRAGRAVVGTLDRYEVQGKVAAKRALAESLCAKAKLPKEAVTPFFLSTLVECKTEKHMMEAIEDRRQLTGIARSSRPRSADPNIPLEESTKPKNMTEKELKEHNAKMEQAFLADVFKDN